MCSSCGLYAIMDNYFGHSYRLFVPDVQPFIFFFFCLGFNVVLGAVSLHIIFLLYQGSRELVTDVHVTIDN